MKSIFEDSDLTADSRIRHGPMGKLDLVIVDRMSAGGVFLGTGMGVSGSCCVE
jgi:hypothetical protein